MCIAFLDLLGIKSIALYDIEKYKDAIEYFQQELLNCSKSAKDIFIYAYSDCAYVQANDLEQMIIFLREFRFRMLLENLFFNAAITKGKLDASVKTENHNVVVSFNDNQTIQAYMKQVLFKGVGVYIDCDIPEDMEKYVAKSLYQPQYDQLGFVSFYDIKYKIPSKKNRCEYMVLLMNRIVSEYLKQSFLNKSAARYYISAITTLINGMNLEDIFKLENEIVLGLTALGEYLKEEIIKNKEYEILGTNWMGFLIIENIIKEWNQKGVLDPYAYIKESIKLLFDSEIDKFIRNMIKVPETLISSQARQTVVELYYD